jgi:hypothetical protein
MRTIITTTLITLCLGSCLIAQEFHITGITSDLPDSTLVCLKNVDLDTPIDTTYIEANRFKFNGEINEGYNQYVLILPKMKRTKPAFFFVENTAITIDLRNKKYVNDAIITGGRIQNQHAELVAILHESKQKYNSIELKISSKNNHDLRSDLIKKRNELYFKIDAKTLDFIKSHPDYEYSAFLLDELSINKSNAEIQTLFNSLSDDVKQSKYGKLIANNLKL